MSRDLPLPLPMTRSPLRMRINRPFCISTAVSDELLGVLHFRMSLLLPSDFIPRTLAMLLRFIGPNRQSTSHT